MYYGRIYGISTVGYMHRRLRRGRYGRYTSTIVPCIQGDLYRYPYTAVQLYDFSFPISHFSAPSQNPSGPIDSRSSFRSPNPAISFASQNPTQSSFKIHGGPIGPPLALRVSPHSSFLGSSQNPGDLIIFGSAARLLIPVIPFPSQNPGGYQNGRGS